MCILSDTVTPARKQPSEQKSKNGQRKTRKKKQTMYLFWWCIQSCFVSVLCLWDSRSPPLFDYISIIVSDATCHNRLGCFVDGKVNWLFLCAAFSKRKGGRRMAKLAKLAGRDTQKRIHFCRLPSSPHAFSLNRIPQMQRIALNAEQLRIL